MFIWVQLDGCGWHWIYLGSSFLASSCSSWERAWTWHPPSILWSPRWARCQTLPCEHAPEIRSSQLKSKYRHWYCIDIDSQHSALISIVVPRCDTFRWTENAWVVRSRSWVAFTICRRTSWARPRRQCECGELHCSVATHNRSGRDGMWSMISMSNLWTSMDLSPGLPLECPWFKECHKYKKK